MTGFASWQRYCTASSSGRQPNFAALNRRRHLCSTERQSRWALARILVVTASGITCKNNFGEAGSIWNWSTFPQGAATGHAVQLAYCYYYYCLQFLFNWLCLPKLLHIGRFYNKSTFWDYYSRLSLTGRMPFLWSNQLGTKQFVHFRDVIRSRSSIFCYNKHMHVCLPSATLVYYAYKTAASAAKSFSLNG